MNTINEKVEPTAYLRSEVDQSEENVGSTSGTSWLDRLEEWVNFFRDVVKILAE
jgi:hypothetical protein